jgi:hypothetical protein
MLHEAKERLIDAGAVPVTSYTDETGTWGYRILAEDYEFVLVAKEFIHDGVVSFLSEAVERACDNDDWLLFYNGKDGRYLVFDPEHVKEHGTQSTGRSKTREAEWYEMPEQDGVNIIEFVERREPPATADETKRVGLDPYIEG